MKKLLPYLAFLSICWFSISGCICGEKQNNSTTNTKSEVIACGEVDVIIFISTPKTSLKVKEKVKFTVKITNRTAEEIRFKKGSLYFLGFNGAYLDPVFDTATSLQHFPKRESHEELVLPPMEVVLLYLTFKAPELKGPWDITLRFPPIVRKDADGRNVIKLRDSNGVKIEVKD